jgi:metal-responsive CopG/Arc/MetJ family transcriptional regulator
MRRTQLYLDESLWTALHSQARREGTTVSELVRQAARERYLGNQNDRGEAMLAIIGIRKDRELPDSTKYIRDLRHGNRLDQLNSRKP